MTDTPTDDFANNLVATGALLMVLTIAAERHAALTSVTLPEDGGPGNRIDLRFDFLGSPYRITVQRVSDD